MGIPLGVKRLEREADYSLATSAKVKKTWIYTPTLPYIFMALCLTSKAQEHFYPYMNPKSELNTYQVFWDLTPKWEKSYIIYKWKGWDLGSKQASGNQALFPQGWGKKGARGRKEQRKVMYSEHIGSRFLPTELHGITSHKTVSKLKYILELIIYYKQVSSYGGNISYQYLKFASSQVRQLGGGGGDTIF
jgi:hypothetical protein